MNYMGNVTATSIYIPMTNCSDNGLYAVTAGNTLGEDTRNFTLAVESKLYKTIIKHELFFFLYVFV